MSGALRVGVDVGGTFTKAVAISTQPVELRAQAVVPTSHNAAEGVAAGVAAALAQLLDELGPDDRARVQLVAYSTTTAMNALLEGDVARVGVVGLGAQPDLRRARKRTRPGDLALARGRVLHTEHAFLDVTHGLDATAVAAALDDLQARGCTAIAISGAFAVDAPEHETQVADACRERALPVCAGHELTGTYGLEVRTVSAAINAAILGVVERTATVVQDVLHDVGVDVPLLVLRGDGGAMSLDAFRRTPSFTVGSGPAAGVAAALHQLGLADGVVLECGGTSSNVSVVRRGRTVLRSLRVMGRPTAISSVDSWVVGAAGGSMARLGRRGVAGTGPRSAHVAGLPYACFADAERLADAQIELIAPRTGDPQEYAVLVARDGARFALTATCAATALGLVEGRLADAALAGFAVLGARIRKRPEEAARQVLDAAVEQIADAVGEAAHTHGFGSDVPVVALGGAGGALAGEVARRLGRPLLTPAHPEVLSSIGAALSLVRAEVRRHGNGARSTIDLIHEAEAACVAAGAAPLTVSVETSFTPDDGVLVAIATGAVALQAGIAGREPLDADGQRRAAAGAIGVDVAALHDAGATAFYRVFRDDDCVAVVDALGAVPVADRARTVISCDDAAGLLDALSPAVRARTMDLGIAALPPRVSVIAGPHVVDLSEHRRPEDVLAGAAAAVQDADGPAIAVVWA